MLQNESMTFICVVMQDVALQKCWLSAKCCEGGCSTCDDRPAKKAEVVNFSHPVTAPKSGFRRYCMLAACSVRCMQTPALLSMMPVGSDMNRSCKYSSQFCQ